MTLVTLIIRFTQIILIILIHPNNPNNSNRSEREDGVVFDRKEFNKAFSTDLEHTDWRRQVRATTAQQQCDKSVTIV
jgi:hypothetical protein